ncbi:hypothetical protein APA_2743 [Pseudanabaena sp. lw0831]|nr:hypothetical protein APA_2743 [Pseudanabaena sp. lw0831]
MFKRAKPVDILKVLRSNTFKISTGLNAKRRQEMLDKQAR